MKATILIAIISASLLLASCGSSSGVGPTSPTLPSGTEEWTWVGGANVVDQNGDYGVQGTPAPANIPGARSQGAIWTDASGNVWLFGGGYNVLSGTDVGRFNDLWKYSAGLWTWMGGANGIDQSGTYGTLGVGAQGNIPGARRASAQWTDAAGNLWLFGGNGYDSAATESQLNDLWKYSAGEWTWVGGSNTASTAAIGIYGVQGMAAPGNFPGGREDAVSWSDAAGNFWLFGGFGFDSAGGGPSELDDLWKYSAGQWTWMGGPNVVNQKGVYGIQGSATSGTIPGARWGAAHWTDKSGNLWLFGGYGYDSAGTAGSLNDLWKYSAGQWTWMGGSNVVNQKGTYGTQGSPSGSNIPGARYVGAAWTDMGGNFWLFGGFAIDSVGALGRINDLWEFSAGQWTWVSGPSDIHQNGAYGTQGSAAPGNIPGAREFPVGWTDASGNFWLFGGNGFDSAGSLGVLNDLWKYEP